MAAVVLSAFPSFIEPRAVLDHPSRQRRRAPHRGHPGRLSRRQARRIDVDGLFDPHGPYRYLNGVNVAALVAIAAGAGAYYVVPSSWVKVVWGVGVGAAVYLAIIAVERAVTAQPAREASL